MVQHIGSGKAIRRGVAGTVVHFEFLQPFGDAMTSSTFADLLAVMFGWVMCRRRTVTGTVAADVAAGPAVPRHRGACRRVFSAGRWSLDAVGLGMLRAAAALAGATVFPAVDDTPCRRPLRLR